MNLTLCLTHDCEMACSYCYAGRKRKHSMTVETAAQAISFASAQDSDTFQLGFFGGEPLLEWDLLQECLRITKEKTAGRKLVLTVTTNGIGLTPKRLDWLYENNFYIGLSIDGNRTMHDITRRMRNGSSSYESVLRGLKTALIKPQSVETITVVDPSNVIHTADSIAFLAELGVKRISLNPNFYTEWNTEAQANLEKAYEAAADFMIAAYRSGKPVIINVLDSKIITGLKEGYARSDRCKFGCGELAVAPSGRIYPCERLVGEDNDDSVCIGTVQTGFDEKKYKSLLAKRGNSDLECDSCKLKPRCMNWCGCINYTTTGAIDSAPGILCFHEKLSIRVADRVATILFKERNPHFIKKFYKT